MFISNSALLFAWLYWIWMLQIAYLSTDAVYVLFAYIFLQSFSLLVSKTWVKNALYRNLLMYQQMLFILCLCILSLFDFLLLDAKGFWVKNMLFRYSVMRSSLCLNRRCFVLFANIFTIRILIYRYRKIMSEKWPHLSVCTGDISAPFM